MAKERITIRLTANQMLVLEELRDKLNVNISLLLRTIIGSWLQTNDEIIEKIITGEKEYESPFNNIEEENDEND